MLRRLAALNITMDHVTPMLSEIRSATSQQTQRAAAATLICPPVATVSDNQQEVVGLLFAFRKLREGIVASDRADEFTAQAYLFCIRLAIFARHPATYYPAILHVMRRFHPANLLSSVEAV